MERLNNIDEGYELYYNKNGDKKKLIELIQSNDEIYDADGNKI